jgi:predicted dehydrogenase
VLIEKPLASSVSEANKLLKVARERGLQVMCDHTYCYTPAVMKLRELIHAGDLGDILYLDSVRINLGLVQRDIDVFWDLAPHDLSILDFILPAGYEPTAVSAHGADPMGVGRACIGYLTLPITKGAIAHAHVNWLSPTKIRTTIVGGSRRTIVWDDLHPTQRLSLYDRGVDVSFPNESEDEERRDRLVAYRIGDMVAPALREGEALASVMTEFAAAIRENRPPLTDGEAGRRILEILEAASVSTAAQGATVQLASRRSG